jgi:hypothetical protein
VELVELEVEHIDLDSVALPVVLPTFAEMQAQFKARLAITRAKWGIVS